MDWGNFSAENKDETAPTFMLNGVFNPDLSLEFCYEGLKHKKIKYLGRGGIASLW